MSHHRPLSVLTGTIKSTAAAWFNHSLYSDIWHRGDRKSSSNRCVPYRTMNQRVLTYFPSLAVRLAQGIPPAPYSHSQSILTIPFHTL